MELDWGQNGTMGDLSSEYVEKIYSSTKLFLGEMSGRGVESYRIEVWIIVFHKRA